MGDNREAFPPSCPTRLGVESFVGGERIDSTPHEYQWGIAEICLHISVVFPAVGLRDGPREQSSEGRVGIWREVVGGLWGRH